MASMRKQPLLSEKVAGISAFYWNYLFQKKRNARNSLLTTEVTPPNTPKGNRPDGSPEILPTPLQKCTMGKLAREK